MSRNDSLEYSLPYLHCTLNIKIRPRYHREHHATFVVELYVITPYKTNTIYMSHCKDIQNHKASPEYTQMLSLSTCNRVIKLQELIEFVCLYLQLLVLYPPLLNPLSRYIHIVGKHVDLNGSTRHFCVVNVLSNTL